MISQLLITDIIQRNRIVIAVTHLDLWYKPASSDEEDDIHEEEGSENKICARKLHMDVEDVCRVVQDYFAKSTGLHLTDKVLRKVVIPLSLEHAILAHKAKLCPSNKNKSSVKCTVEKDYRNKYSMGGANCPPNVEELELHSQFPALEER